MKYRILTILVIVLFVPFVAPSAFASTFRIDPTPVQTTAGNVAVGGYPAVYAVPNATIKLCTDSTCATPATAYTDATGNTPCPSLSPVTLPGTSVCVSASGAQGQFGFWLNSGTYYFQVTTPSGQTFGPFPLSAPSSGGGGGGISGSGTANTIPKFTGSTSVGNSAITDDGSKVSISEPLILNGTSANSVIFANASGVITSDSGFTWNQSFKVLTIQTAGSNGQFLEHIQNTSLVSGSGNGLLVQAGNTSSDFPFIFSNEAGLSLFYTNGLGSSVATSSVSGTATFTVNNTASSPGADGLAVNAGATTSDIVVSVNSRTASPLFTVNGVGDAKIAGGVVLPTATMTNTEVLYACPALGTGGLNKICGAGNLVAGNFFTWGESAGQVAIQNGGTLFPLQVSSTGGTGNSFGVTITAGTNGSDSPLFIQATNLTSLFHIFGDGGIVVSNWADQGLGSVNASNYYVRNTLGLAGTATMRNSAGSGTCTITFLGGLATATTC